MVTNTPTERGWWRKVLIVSFTYLQVFTSHTHTHTHTHIASLAHVQRRVYTLVLTQPVGDHSFNTSLFCSSCVCPLQPRPRQTSKRTAAAGVRTMQRPFPTTRRCEMLSMPRAARCISPCVVGTNGTHHRIQVWGTRVATLLGTHGESTAMERTGEHSVAL